MTNHNNDKNRFERPLGHLAAVVSHRSRGAIHAALAEADISRRDLRLLAVLEREPQTAEALEERRAARRERHSGGEHGEHSRKRHGGFHGRRRGHGKRRSHDEQGSNQAGSDIRRRMTLSEKLDDLTTRGLIAADADGTLRVTEQGAALRQSGRASLAALKERSTAGISEGDLETTRRTLQTLASNLAS